MADGRLAFSWLVRIILEGVSVGLRQCLSDFVVFVDVSNELIVIDVGQVSSVHVLLQEQVEMSLTWWEYIELLQDSDKLVLGDVANLGDIEVFELWFQV